MRSRELCGLPPCNAEYMACIVETVPMSVISPVWPYLLIFCIPTPAPRPTLLLTLLPGETIIYIPYSFLSRGDCCLPGAGDPEFCPNSRIFLVGLRGCEAKSTLLVTDVVMATPKGESIMVGQEEGRGAGWVTKKFVRQQLQPRLENGAMLLGSCCKWN